MEESALNIRLDTDNISTKSLDIKAYRGKYDIPKTNE
jgi:hypothetical protein